MNAVTPAEVLAQLAALLGAVRGECELRLESKGLQCRWRIVLEQAPKERPKPPDQKT